MALAEHASVPRKRSLLMADGSSQVAQAVATLSLCDTLASPPGFRLALPAHRHLTPSQ